MTTRPTLLDLVYHASGPHGQDRFTEQLVRFDSLSMYFLPPPLDDIPLSIKEAFRDTYGLRHGQPIIGCPQVDIYTYALMLIVMKTGRQELSV